MSGKCAQAPKKASLQFMLTYWEMPGSRIKSYLTGVRNFDLQELCVLTVPKHTASPHSIA